MYINEKNSEYWDDFLRWASRNLGQGYSLEVDDGLIVDRVTAWAFIGYAAGRNHDENSNHIDAKTLKKMIESGQLDCFEDFKELANKYNIKWRIYKIEESGAWFPMVVTRDYCPDRISVGKTSTGVIVDPILG